MMNKYKFTVNTMIDICFAIAGYLIIYDYSENIKFCFGIFFIHWSIINMVYRKELK